MPNLFDGQAFSQELRTAMEDAGLTYRALAVIAHVDHASIYRAAKGLTPSLETYLRLCAWMDEENA